MFVSGPFLSQGPQHQWSKDCTYTPWEKTLQAWKAELGSQSPAEPLGYDCNPIYRSLHTPEPRNPQKVSKSRSRASRPGVSKKCRKSPRTLILESFWLIFESFETFSTLFWHSWPGGPGTPFWDFLGISGPEDLGTPVYGGRTRNVWGSAELLFNRLFTMSRRCATFCRTFLPKVHRILGTFGSP